MNLATMRMVVTSNMPYDSGFMFTAGAKFFENEHFMLCKYDTERVPYIIYNEEGTIFSTKNQYFIRKQTMGDLMRHESYNEAGMQANEAKLDKAVKRKGSLSMISQGAMEKIRSDTDASNI
jgi:hypothetical protein